MLKSRAALVDALPRTVVALANGDVTVGTGFFVAPGLVLTCAHVVPEPGKTITARWGSEEFTLDAPPEWSLPGPDLALLRTTQELDHPVVCLAADVEPGDELWGYGHPAGPYRAGDSVTFRATGPSLRGSDALHNVSHGRAGPGFSGGPVVNWRTGGVCGVLRFGYGLDRGLTGARLITVDEIAAAYPFLDPPSAVTAYRQAWLRLLDDDQVRLGGWRFPGPVLRDYLESVRDAARNHPYALGEPNAARPLLSDVYLGQQLVRYGLTGVPKASLPRLPADGVLDAVEPILIIGGPGAGKSSMLRQLTMTAASQWLDGVSPPSVVPVPVPARALLQRGDLGSILREAVHDGLSAPLWRALPEDFFAGPPAADTLWLVIVDGIDEVLDPAARKAVIETLAKLWRSPERGFRVVASTRPLPGAEIEPLLDLGVAYQLELFSAEALAEFAARWFSQLGYQDPAGLADGFTKAMRDSDIDRLAGIPLIATMLVLVFAERPQTDLPHSRTDLYEEFVGLFLGKMHRRPNSALSQLQEQVAGWGSAASGAVDRLIQGIRGLLEQVAVTLQQGSTESPIDLAVSATEDIRPANVTVPDWRAIVREVIAQSGLITEADGAVSFLHHTMQEFLAACAYVRDNEPDPRGDFEHFVGKLDEKLVDAPKDYSYARFVFTLWSRKGKDTGSLVLRLFEVDNGDGKKKQDAESKALLPPGEGTGLTAVLLREQNAIPDRVRSVVIDRLRQVTLIHGRVWAASAVAAVDRGLGLELLTQMALGSSLAIYVRLEAAQELARWDKAAAVELLAGLAERGPVLGGDTSWRSLVGVGTYVFPVPLDEWTALSMRLLAAMHLADLDTPRAVGILDAMVRDEERPLWDRVRVALVLGQLDSGLAQTRLGGIPGLVAGEVTPEVVRSLARTSPDEEPRVDLLTAWAQDATRSGEERTLAALALATSHRAEAVAQLRSLVGPGRRVRIATTSSSFTYTSPTTYVVNERSATWVAEPRRGSPVRMPLYVSDDLVAAARKLAEIDRRAAAMGLHDRLVANTHEPLPRAIVDVLAAIDHKTAVKALVGRVGDAMFDEQVAAARHLVELDPKVAKRVLGKVARRAFPSSKKLDVAEVLALADRDAAIDIIANVFTVSFTFGSDRVQALHVVHRIAPDLCVPLLTKAAGKRHRMDSEDAQLAFARHLAEHDPQQALRSLSRLAEKAFFSYVKDEAQALHAAILAGEPPENWPWGFSQPFMGMPRGQEEEPLVISGSTDSPDADTD